MKYCSKCGKELMDDAVFCTGCGCAADPSMGFEKREVDKVNVGFCVLAFFIPIFGLIYWAIKRQETPKNANAVGLTALISWGINFVSTMILSAVYANTFADLLSRFLV